MHSMSLSKKILMLQLHVALQPAVQHPKGPETHQPFQRLPERAGERRLGISAVAILSDVEMDDGCRKKGETKPSVFLYRRIKMLSPWAKLWRRLFHALRI